MSIYVVTGKLGNGKTLLAVSKIREALAAGRRVATNLDLHLEHLLPVANRDACAIRLPDKPCVDDLAFIGKGCDVVDESRYGLLVLDELGSWLNARDWADKGRQKVIDWLIHSRKHRWDVIFIVQHSNMIDKQVREALLEYLVTCKRLDKVRIPFFGRLGQFFSLGAWDGRVGRLHLGVVVYAAGSVDPRNAMVVDRWLYRGTSLFQAYDTEQVFSSTYADGVFSYLPPWQAIGRYQVPQDGGWLRWLRSWLPGAVGPAVQRPIKPKHALVSRLMRFSPDYRVRHVNRLIRCGAIS